MHAISAETRAIEWLYEQHAATMSLVATGGCLVFGGDVDGRFRAVNDETGEVLREVNLGSAVTGFPVTDVSSTAASTCRSTPAVRVRRPGSSG